MSMSSNAESTTPSNSPVDVDETEESSSSHLPDLRKQLGAATLYGGTSVLMTLTNKWIVTTWSFGNTHTVLFLQMIFSYAILQLLSSKKIIDIGPFDRRVAWRLLPLSMFYLANVACALTALRLTSLPVYNVLKRMTPFPVMIVDRLWRSKKASTPIQVSVATIVIGAVLTGSGDLDFDIWGYSLAVASCILQSLYLVAVAKAGDMGLSSDGMMLYNSILSLPVLTILVLVLESREVITYPHYTNPWFLWCLLSGLTMGSLLNYTLFLCTTVNSALTTTIVGQAKALLTTLLGFFLFGKVRLSGLGLLGVTLNVMGGVLYAYIKYQQQTATRRE